MKLFSEHRAENLERISAYFFHLRQNESHPRSSRKFREESELFTSIDSQQLDMRQHRTSDEIKRVIGVTGTELLDIFPLIWPSRPYHLHPYFLDVP